MKKLKFYCDPGHGWIACKIKLLHDLGIANQISRYSYMRGKTAYLEEDRDAGILLDALKNNGIEFSVIEKYTDRISPIRSYYAWSVSCE